jgi:hypothetical protein
MITYNNLEDNVYTCKILGLQYKCIYKIHLKYNINVKLGENLQRRKIHEKALKKPVETNSESQNIVAR